MSEQPYKFNELDDNNVKKINEILRLLSLHTEAIYQKKQSNYDMNLTWVRKRHGTFGANQFKHTMKHIHGYYEMISTISDVVWYWSAQIGDILCNQEEFENAKEVDKFITQANERLFKVLVNSFRGHLSLDYKRLKEIVSVEEAKHELNFPHPWNSLNLFPRDIPKDELTKVGEDGMTLEERGISETGEKVYYFSNWGEYCSNVEECIRWHKELTGLKPYGAYETIDERIALVFKSFS